MPRPHVALAALITAGSLLSASCTSPPPATQGTSTPTATDAVTTTSAVASTSAAPAGPPKFEVHEWGLVDVDGKSARILAGPHGPKPKSPPRPVRKPVLYFHLLGGTQAVEVSVKVSVPSPGVQEYFPQTGTLTNARKDLTWGGLRLRKGACHYHLARETSCNASDGCETAELPNYETDDSACIESGKDGFNLLFYRGAVSGDLELPFDILDGGSSLKVTRASKATDFVGPIVYVRRRGGELAISVSEPPPAGGSIELTAPTDKDSVVAQRAIDQAMREVGLSNDEAAAFDRAWSGELYDLEQGKKVVRRDQAERDVLLFALPASMIDALATLTIEPAPVSTKRFMLVRYEL